MVDIIIGVLNVVSGSILYWQNYKKPERRAFARAGLGMVIGGTLLASTRWLIAHIVGQ